MSGFVCYTNQIRATINAIQPIRSKILNVSQLRRFGGGHFLYRYKILPQINEVQLICECGLLTFTVGITIFKNANKRTKYNANIKYTI